MTRVGLGGRTRHVDVKYLWLQARVESGEIRLHKVRGTINPTDVATKYVTQS